MSISQVKLHRGGKRNERKFRVIDHVCVSGGAHVIFRKGDNMKIHCLVCGKDVCPVELPDNTIIRAWIECPECAGGEKGSYIEGVQA